MRANAFCFQEEGSFAKKEALLQSKEEGSSSAKERNKKNTQKLCLRKLLFALLCSCTRTAYV